MKLFQQVKHHPHLLMVIQLRAISHPLIRLAHLLLQLWDCQVLIWEAVIIVPAVVFSLTIMHLIIYQIWSIRSWLALTAQTVLPIIPLPLTLTKLQPLKSKIIFNKTQNLPLILKQITHQLQKKVSLQLLLPPLRTLRKVLAANQAKGQSQIQIILIM